MISSDTMLLKPVDKKSFKELFDQNFNALCSFAVRYVQDAYSAEDIVQETFIQFWNKKETFEHINAVKAYLYKSVRNKCLNFIRDQAVLQRNKSTYDIESDEVFEHHIIEEETFNILFNEIKNLPDSSKEVMLLALNGLKNQEIADELNVSINTVKTQKKIAYAKLKTRIHPIMNNVLLCL